MDEDNELTDDLFFTVLVIYRARISNQFEKKIVHYFEPLNIHSRTSLMVPQSIFFIGSIFETQRSACVLVHEQDKRFRRRIEEACEQLKKD